jgi:hypothetical protein
VAKKRLSQTTAHVRITRQCWYSGEIAGEVVASAYAWEFFWRFRGGELVIEPSLGRALIREPLSRFLEEQDYKLEPGGDYSFTIRSEL